MNRVGFHAHIPSLVEESGHLRWLRAGCHLADVGEP
jgi:hypothetical protein